MGADAWGVADRFYRGARPVWTLEVSSFGSARSFCLDVYYAGYILLLPDLALLVASATSLPDVVFREPVSLYRACLASGVPKVYAAALPLLLVLTIAVQGAGWWAGRNNRLQPGWLPIQVRTASQTALDEWIRGVQQSGQTGLRIKAIVPGPLNERWSLDHSFVVNHVRSDVLDLEELHVQADKAILEGQLPERAFEADIVLLDPQAVYYPAVINTLTQRIPGVASKQIHSHIIALLLSERARTFIVADSTSTQA